MPNPYVNKVTVNNVTIIDLTEDTVTASTLMQGYTAHDKSGALITGTADITEGSVYQDGDGYLVVDDSESSAPQGNLSITANGTYDVSDYAGASVDVGGSTSNWTLLESVDVQYATSTSTSTSVTTLNIPVPYDPTRILWISIRDTQGKKDGYYYGSDCIYLANSVKDTSGSQYCFIRCIGTTSGFWQSSTGAPYGGIFPINPILGTAGMTLYFQGKYSSTYGTGTIDSTYRISVYFVDYPSELSPIGAGL